MGRADTVSHKFRRKSKVKETKSEEASSAHNVTCSSFSPLPNAMYEEDYVTTLQDGGDKELEKLALGSELLASESLTELPLVEKLSDCSLSAPSLFADSDMEVFQPSPSTTASFAKEISLEASLLRETAECLHSDPTEICNNEIVSVSSSKIWKDDCLLMVWLVTNKSDSELKSANLEIFPAENFKVSQ